MNGLLIMFRWIILSSVMGSVLTVVILLTKVLFKRKLDAVWHYYIWMVLLIRLLMPYAPQSSLSIFNLITPMTGNTIHILDNQKAKKEMYTPADQENITSKDLTKRITKAIAYQKSNTKVIPSTHRNSCVKIDFNTLIMLVWFFGTVVSLIYILTINLRFWFKIRGQKPCSDKNIQRLFHECKSIMNIHAELPVMYTEKVNTPAIYGLIKPRLLLPYNMVHQLGNEEIKYIFFHELTHYKHKDLIIKWLAVIIKILHWFNPVIWYGFYQMHQDCELACDAHALSYIEPDKQIEYGYTILHLLKLVAVHKMAPGTVGILSLSNKLQMKRRITMITNFRKSTLRSIIAAALIFTLIGITGLTNPQQAIALSSNSQTTLLSKDDLLNQSKEKTVALWAEAFSQRQISFRYAILSLDLKEKEYKKDYKNMNWIIGSSSPWVVNYSIKKVNKIDSSTYRYEIKYNMTDSTRTKYNSHEYVTVTKYGENWFVTKYDKFYLVPKITQSKKAPYAKVQPGKADALITKDKKGTVILWAEALKQRNGTLRYAVLTDKLKRKEYKNMNQIIAASSPYIVSYTVTKKDKINKGTYLYEIQYKLTDSTKKIYHSQEYITVKKIGDNWYVSKHDNYKVMPKIK